MPDINWKDWLAGLSVDSIGGAEKLPVLDATTPKHVTAALLSAYTIDQLVAAGALTPTAGDALLMERSGTEGTMDLDALASYVVASGWSVASEADPATSADKFLIERSGTVYELDIDTLVAYVNSANGTLGAQVNSLGAATLADADEYLVVQGSTPLKTTFSDIAARVHSQLQTYLSGLSAVTSLADANTFYVDQSGTAKKVTATVLASYIHSEIAGDVTSTAFDSSAVGSALSGDLALIERSGVAKTIDVDNLATFVVDSQSSASAATPAATGDDFLIFRGGTQYQMDIDVLSSYVLETAWDATSGNPVATGDVVAIGRSGSTLSVTVDQLKTYVTADAQTTALDFSGLSVGTLADADTFAMDQGASTTKVTAANLAAYVQSEVGSAIVQSAWDYSSVGSGLAGDVFVMERSNVGKTITLANVASYAVGTQDSASSDSSPASGDEYLMFRSGTQYKVDVDDVASYVNDQQWSAASGSPVVDTDKFAIGRSSSTLSVTAAQLQTYILADLQSEQLDFSGLSAASLAGTDLFAVYNGSSPEKVTLANLETQLWSDYATYLAGLSAVTAPVDADLFYTVQSGTPKKVTATVLAGYMDDELWSLSAATPTIQAADDLMIRRSGTTYSLDVDELASYVNTSVQSSVLNISGLTDATLDATDYVFIGESTNARKATIAQLETQLWSDFSTYVAGLTQVGTTAVDDKFYCIQGGAPKFVTPAELNTYFNTTNGDVIAPSSNTPGKVPAWDTGAKTLTDGYEVVTSIRSVVGGASDTAFATELAVRNAIGGISDIDISSGTDIGADLVDADLIVVDDGASGTTRKSALSRVWSYVEDKIQGLTAKATPVDADILTIQDSAAAYALKELTVANLWDNRYLADAQAIKLDDFASPDDNTDLNATTSAHGLCPKGSGSAAEFLRGDLTWGTPAANDVASLDIDGTADIAADLSDADLFIVDDGAGGTNRKSEMSRVWTYITGKIQSAASKSSPLDGDKLLIQDSENSDEIRELTVGNLWDNRYLADMQAIADISSATWVLDEDNMSSNSNVAVPTQQSVKAYVDNVAGTQNNLSASSVPGVSNDQTQGYSVGSFWVNTTSDIAYICVDSTTGAAVWENLTVSAAGWDGDLTDVNWTTASEIGGDLAATDQIAIGDASDSSNPKRANLSRVKDYIEKAGTYANVYIDAGSMKSCTTNGAAAGENEYGTNDIDFDYFAFDGGATEERVQFKLAMPEDWDRGTIKVKFYWTSASGSSAADTVEWGIKGGSLSDDDAIDAALGTAVTVSDAVTAANGSDIQITSATPALTIAGSPALGDLIVFEVYRNTDGTDDMAEDAWLLGLMVQYQKNQTVSAW